MKFGIFSTVTKADDRSVQQLFKENLEQVVYAEQLGYDNSPSHILAGHAGF